MYLADREVSNFIYLPNLQNYTPQRALYYLPYLPTGQKERVAITYYPDFLSILLAYFTTIGKLYLTSTGVPF
jgi:hypothetical protein